MKNIIRIILFIGITLVFQNFHNPTWATEEQKIAQSQKHRDLAIAELKNLLNTHPEWKKLLLESIKSADVKGIDSLDSYYKYLRRLLTWIPIEGELYLKLTEFYWLLDQPAGRKLQEHKPFQDWMVKFIENRGKFLDTQESAKGISTFSKDRRFHMEEAAQNPGGWMSFNQFFARALKPGRRPITGLCDDTVIVSPADSVFKRASPISDNLNITVKNIPFSIAELLKDSPYKDRFEGGSFMHGFLNVTDYHRFHTPVGGVIREVRNIPGKVYLDVGRKENGTYFAKDGTGYQFTQQRGFIIIESPEVGFVAVLPIGMAQVSSVMLNAEVGSTLTKGEEFGFFQFGGSDIIMLFQKGRVNITAEKGKHYNQGEKIGVATTSSKK